jgi:hypothetical protein
MTATESGPVPAGTSALTVSQALAAVNLRLALLGLPRVQGGGDDEALVGPLLERQRELSRRLADRLPPVDERIAGFLDDYLAGHRTPPRLPRRTLALDLPGPGADPVACRSTPIDYASELITSYRLANGVLHNPRNDRRTTAGVFHIAEGGLPIPDDKLAVPRETFALLAPSRAHPRQKPCPGVADHVHPGRSRGVLRLAAAAPAGRRRRAGPDAGAADGDPVHRARQHGRQSRLRRRHLRQCRRSLPAGERFRARPAALDRAYRLVILAPHLDPATKPSLGLPHRDKATERQIRDGMCWTDPAERYNGGKAFKVCARDERGVIVTIIADNYFGYCKKEVKTQISILRQPFRRRGGGALRWRNGLPLLGRGPGVRQHACP